MRQETDAAGAVLAVRRYYSPRSEAEWDDPYGVPITGDGGQPYGYSGEWWDAETELVYLRARYLRPELGLFLTKDPWPGDVLRPGTLNGYGYGLGNPVIYRDPTGHASVLFGDGLLTPVGILDPNRVRDERQRQVLFAWYLKMQRYYEPAEDSVLKGETYAGAIDVTLTNSILAMEYGLWQLDCGDPAGADVAGAGLVLAVLSLGPGGGGSGQNRAALPYSAQELSDAAARIVTGGGLSAAGRSLQKHSNRAQGSYFQKPAGTLNPENYNLVAQEYVDDLLTDPASIWTIRSTRAYNEVVEVSGSHGQSLFFRSSDGSFIGFSEPKSGAARDAEPGHGTSSCG